jgi:hypothetical protein
MTDLRTLYAAKERAWQDYDAAFWNRRKAPADLPDDERIELDIEHQRSLRAFTLADIAYCDALRSAAMEAA